MGRLGDGMNNLHAWIDLQFPLQMVQYSSLAKIYITKCKEARYIFNADVNIRNIALCAASKTEMFTHNRGPEMDWKASFVQRNALNYSALCCYC